MLCQRTLPLKQVNCTLYGCFPKLTCNIEVQHSVIVKDVDRFARIFQKNVVPFVQIPMHKRLHFLHRLHREHMCNVLLLLGVNWIMAHEHLSWISKPIVKWRYLTRIGSSIHVSNGAN